MALSKKIKAEQISLRVQGVRVWFLEFLNFNCLSETQVEMSINQLIQGDRSVEFTGKFLVGAVY